MSGRKDEGALAAPDPPFVFTPADKRRWDLCQAIAKEIFEQDAAGVWMAARALFRSDLDTGD